MSKKTVGPAAPVLSQPFMVALSNLHLEDNVRSPKSVSAEGIKSMAAMLLSTGQINPLVVIKIPGKRGHFAVKAGGRRFRGFMLLLKEGKVQLDHQIEVREVDEARSADVGLIENISQEPMHPADEFLAFKELNDKGYSAEAVAKVFGVKPLHVKRRMKLGCLHPELLEQFRAKDMDLEQVTALAACEDQARQILIWKSLDKWSRSEHHIRQRLREDQVSVQDPRVKLVGLATYVAAGGQVVQDLFSESGKEETLTDVGLLEMLVAEKLEAQADQLRAEGWAWVEVLHDFGYDERKNFRSYPTNYRPETSEQALVRAGLEEQIAAKDEQCEALLDKEDEEEGDDAAMDALHGQMHQLEQQIEDLRESRIDLSHVDMLLAGAVVYANDGQVVVHKPMIRAADLNKVSKPTGSNGSAVVGSHGDGKLSGSGDAEQVSDLSERLLMNLTAQRTAAVQASMIEHQTVALAALAAHMAEGVFMRGYKEGALKISVHTHDHLLREASPTLKGSLAHEAILAEHDALRALLTQQEADLLGFFLAQDIGVSLRFIAYVSAISVNGVRGKNSRSDVLAQLVTALKLDMRQWWEPNEASFLSYVPKAKMIEAVKEAKGDEATKGMDKMKKADVTAHAAAALAGSGWLPAELR